MNERFQFRAWHKYEKIMCAVSIINFKSGAFLVGVKPGELAISDNGRMVVLAPSNGRFCEWDEFELMQSTGLKDKNGTLIYEGDIVEDEVSIEAIEWSDEESGWILANDGSLLCINLPTKVIGNIYEHLHFKYGR